jgi:hypothetical protein
VVTDAFAPPQKIAGLALVGPLNAVDKSIKGATRHP